MHKQISAFVGILGGFVRLEGEVKAEASAFTFRDDGGIEDIKGEFGRACEGGVAAEFKAQRVVLEAAFGADVKVFIAAHEGAFIYEPWAVMLYAGFVFGVFRQRVDDGARAVILAGKAGAEGEKKEEG